MRRGYRTALLCLVVLGTAPTWLWTPNSQASNKQGAAAVKMTNQLRFEPSTIRIKVSQIVVWKNTSFLVHTVTADPELAAKAEDVHLPDHAETFNSGDVSPGKEYSHAFRIPGTYRYFCIPHEVDGMLGTIIVTE